MKMGLLFVGFVWGVIAILWLSITNPLKARVTRKKEEKEPIPPPKSRTEIPRTISENITQSESAIKISSPPESRAKIPRDTSENIAQSESATKISSLSERDASEKPEPALPTRKETPQASPIAEKTDQSSSVNEILRSTMENAIREKQETENELKKALKTSKEMSEKIQRLTENNSRLSSQLTASNKTNTSIREELESVRRSYGEKSDDECKALQTKVNELTQHNDNLTKEISILKHDIERVTGERAVTIKDHQELNDLFKATSQRLIDVTAEFEKLTKQDIERGAKERLIKDEMDKLKEVNTIKDRELTELRNRVNEFLRASEMAVQSKEAEQVNAALDLISLKAELDTEKQQNLTLSRKVAELEKQNATIAENNATLQLERVALGAKISDLTNDHPREISALQTTITHLKTDLARLGSVDEQNAHLSQSLDDINTRMADERAKNAMLSNQVRELLSENANLKFIETECTSTKEALSAAKQELETAKTSLSNRDDEYSNLQKIYKNAIEELAALTDAKEKILELSAKNTALESTNKEYAQTIANLASANDLYDHQNKAFRTQINTLESGVSGAITQNSSLEGKIIALNGSVRLLEGENNALKENIEKLNETINSLRKTESRVEELTANINNLENAAARDTEKYNRLYTEYGYVKELNTSINELLAQQETAIQQKDAEMKKITDAYNETVALYNTSVAAYTELESAIFNATNTNTKESAIEAIAADKRTIKTLSEKAEAQNAEVVKLRSNVTTIEKALSKNNATLASYNATINNKKKEIDTKNEEIANLSGTISRLKGINESLVQQNAQKDEVFTRQAIEAEAIASANVDLNTQLARLNGVIAQKDTDLGVLTEENRELKASSSEMQENINQLSSQNIALSAQIGIMDQRLQHLGLVNTELLRGMGMNNTFNQSQQGMGMGMNNTFNQLQQGMGMDGMFNQLPTGPVFNFGNFN